MQTLAAQFSTDETTLSELVDSVVSRLTKWTAGDVSLVCDDLIMAAVEDSLKTRRAMTTKVLTNERVFAGLTIDLIKNQPGG
jgi:hypothetical protein